MSTSGNPDGSVDPQRVQEIIDDFRLSWYRCPAEADVDITPYLPPLGHSDRTLICGRLVAIDLQQRWSRGRGILLEEYLERYPELKAEPFFLDLLHQEYRLRLRYDRAVEAESYQARFPEHYDSFVQGYEQIESSSLDLETLHAPTLPGSIEVPRVNRTEQQPPEHHNNTLPTQGNYQLIERLGQGQFGEVWRAEAPGGVEVAVKIIKFPVGHKMTQLELQSLEFMKKLRHSFLLQVQAYWVEGEKLFVVMELGDETLQDLANRYAALEERIPSGKLINFFVEASEAIDFLHSQHVLHRDIKPANILLVSGHVKVADFGISRVLSDDQTVTATTMGTPLYMAPEVWQGKASPRSDQYSLAMTYAELRMGRAPYSGKSYYEVMNQHLNQSPNLQLLDAGERQVVRRALAKEPKDRFESCSEFVNALHDVFEPKIPENRRSITPTQLLIGCILVVLVVLVVVGGMIWQSGGRNPARIEADPSSVRVRAGQSVSLDVVVIGGNDVSSSDIELTGLPQDITQTRREEGSIVTFVLHVGLHVQPAEYAARLTGHGIRQAKKVHVEVQAAEVVQVEGYESGGTPIAVGGRVFADRIFCLRGGQQIEFVLIPRESKDDPATFYMMKTKVTNQLFATFVAAESSRQSLLEASKDWHLGGRAGVEDRPASEYPHHPVYGVHIEDAEACAKWLGGRLPSASQWDKAAGRGESEFEGPFNVAFDQLTPMLVAYNRPKLGPAPVTTTSADVSLHLCTDMAGNGYEYTRTSYLSGKNASSVVELRDQNILLRSASYWDPRPYTFNALDIDQPYDEVKRDVSFRVVIEDNRW